MRKKLLGLLVGMSIIFHTSIVSAFDIQQWHEDYMDEHFLKVKMFHKLEEINRQYNLNVEYLTPMEFEVTFYSDLNCENGYGNLTATGDVLASGMVANNYFDFGTQLYIEGLGLKTVKDRGSKKHFSNKNRIDVFVPRNYGESDDEYYTRVNNMGRVIMQGYILED